MSEFDVFFCNSVQNILKNGWSTKGQNTRAKWEDGTEASTVKLFGLVTRYDLAKEFPMQTQRTLNWKASFNELFWIWRDKSNNIKDLPSHIWDAWADETGSIGKAYGYQLAKKSKYKEGWFDQVDRVLYDLKNDPYSRRIMTNIYTFDDLHEMNLYPCAYSMTFNVVDGRLNAILNQRSNDFLVANAWNVAQYALLVMILAQVSGLEVGELVHVIADAHIYERHIPIVEELITREKFDAPRVTLNPDIKNFYDFTIDDILVENYKHGETITGIPVAV